MKRRFSAIFLTLVLCLNGAMPVLASSGVPTLEFLTEAIYDDIGSFSEGLVWVRQGDVYKYLDTDGNVVLDGITQEKYFPGVSGFFILDNFHDGFARIWFDEIVEKQEDNTTIQRFTMYIDKRGEPLRITEVIGDKIVKEGDTKLKGIWGNSFSEGYALTIMGDLDCVTIIDKSGVVRTQSVKIDEYEDYWVSTSSWFREGLSPVAMIGGDEYILGGYITPDFEIAIPLKFEGVTLFEEGVALASIDGKFGIIDKTGKFVIEPQFDNFWVRGADYTYAVFNDGLASVRKDDKWGFIDKTGKTVIPFEFDENGGVFYDGYAVGLIKNGEKVVIDKSGKVLTTLPYEDINNYYNGSLLVGNGGKYQFIDVNGNTLSNETWNFESTRTFPNSQPDTIAYKQNGKWGLAKIVFGESTPAPVVPKTPSLTAKPTASTVLVNGEQVAFDAYNIEGNNYFKLRDLAYAINGTEKQFSVSWDSASNAIALASETSYTAVGSEMEEKGGGDKAVTATTSKIIIDGVEVSLTAYNIDGNNYFKLRDIGEAFDFGVNWDSENNAIVIDTSVGYSA